MGVILRDYNIISHNNDVGLDFLRDALGSGRRNVKPNSMSRAHKIRGQEDQNQKQTRENHLPGLHCCVLRFWVLKNEMRRPLSLR